MVELKRGDVILVRLSGEGSEQVGNRPCVIVSNDICNKHSNVITVAPLTSKILKFKLPTHLVLTTQQYPIHKDSIVMCEQLGKIDKSRIIGDVLFKLNQLEMKRLDRCMAIQLGMVSPNENDKKAI